MDEQNNDVSMTPPADDAAGMPAADVAADAPMEEAPMGDAPAAEGGMGA